MENINVVMLDTVRYQELLDAEEVLRALQRHGVDNWDGYDYAISEWKGEEFDDGL